MKSICLLILFTLFCGVESSAQTGFISGKVTDSTKTAVPAATILLVTGTDTLRTITNVVGKFRLPVPGSRTFTLQVHCLGYISLVKTLTMEKDAAGADLPDLVLNPATTLLNAVEIKGTVKRITIKPDTIEYNAKAYQNQPGDRVRELIKQLPGMDIDGDGNVKTMGKKVVRVKVNGKDFFSGDVKELLAQLPADLISKVQLINDYGELAAFTGENAGVKPVKIINLTTKATINSGIFGEVKTELGTNSHYGIFENSKYWKDTRQLSLNGKSEAGNNGAGTSKQHAAGLNLRDNLGKGLEGGLSYQYGSGSNAGFEDSRIESFGSTADFRSLNKRSDQGTHQSQSLKLQLKQTDKNSLFSLSLEGAYTKNHSVSELLSNQDGAILVDLLNNNSQQSHQRSAKGNLLYAYRFGKVGRNLSVSLGTNTAQVNRNADLDDRISYRDPLAGTSVDSLVNRRTTDHNHPKLLNTVVSYTEPLGEAPNGGKRTASINYVTTLQSGDSDFQTYISNRQEAYHLTDSLSNHYFSRQFQQALELRYVNRNERLDYTFGFNVQSTTISGNSGGQGGNIRQGAIFLLPVANLKYRSTENQSLELAYSGDSNLPEPRYLQPFTDTRNLRQITIGNPKLKPAISHRLLLEYNREGSTGLMLQLNAGFEITRNKVVSNILTTQDSLGGLLQQTRFANADGDNRFESRYNLSIPGFKGRFSLELDGGMGYERNIFFADNRQAFSRQISLQQAAKIRLSTKRLELNSRAGFELTRASFTLRNAVPQQTQVWNITTEGRILFAKYCRFGMQARKTFNSGYFVQQTNPLIVDVSMELLLLKHRQVSIQLQLSDLLAQNNQSSKHIQGNTVVDSRSNQLTRYGLFHIIYRLEQFRKKE